MRIQEQGLIVDNVLSVRVIDMLIVRKVGHCALVVAYTLYHR